MERVFYGSDDGRGIHRTRDRRGVHRVPTPVTVIMLVDTGDIDVHSSAR